MTDQPNAADPDPSGDVPALSPDVVDGGAGGGGLGGLDLGNLLGAAQDMGARMAEAQEEIAATIVEGSAGGGMVTVALDGGFGVRGVTIDPSVVDPSDVAMLEDLVVAAFRDAASQVVELQSSADPMGGLDLGSLGDLFGG